MVKEVSVIRLGRADAKRSPGFGVSRKVVRLSAKEGRYRRLTLKARASSARPTRFVATTLAT
jgi:hypothetical protein